MTTSTPSPDQSRPVDKQPEVSIDLDWQATQRLLIRLTSCQAEADSLEIELHPKADKLPLQPARLLHARRLYLPRTRQAKRK